MPRLRLDLDEQLYDRLVEAAVAERRPIIWQAEITLRRALGLPFPDSPVHETRGAADAVAR